MPRLWQQPMINRHDMLMTTGALLLLLGGCARSEGFPSLAIRDSERITGQMPAPDAAAQSRPAPQPEPTTEIAAIVARARSADTRFRAEQPAAERLITSVAGSASGSDGWSRAQLVIASLEAIRSETMLALADLDQIRVTAQAAGEEATQSTAAVAEVEAMLAGQNRLITALLVRLGT